MASLSTLPPGWQSCSILFNLVERKVKTRIWSHFPSQDECTAVCMAIKEYKRDIYLYLLSTLEDHECEEYVKVTY